jgi:uncharacterized protein (TIGR03067 family)
MRRTFLVALGVVAVAIVPLCAADKEKDKPDAKLDPAKLVGNWTFVSAVRDGNKVAEANLKNDTAEFTKDTITLKNDKDTYVMKYKLDTDKTPCRISIEITKGPQGEGAKTEGIIAVKDGELKLCYPPMGGDVPKDFEAKEGSKLHYFVLKMKK